MTDTVKTWGGIAVAAIKTFSGIAAASVKTIGGIAKAAFATFDPSAKNAGITLSNGNRTATNGVFATGGSFQNAITTGLKSTGKWYSEVSLTGTFAFGGAGVGLALAAKSNTTQLGQDANGYIYDAAGGTFVFNTTALQSSLATYGNGDTISVLFDADAHTLIFWKNGTPIGSTISSIAAGSWAVIIGFRNSENGTASGTVNSGASAFTYTPTAGYSGVTI